MARFLLHLGITALAIAAAAHFVPGVHVHSGLALLVAALVLGFVNAIIRPILVVLTLPITIVTLGIFYLVVNGVAFGIAAALVPGFRVDSLGAAIMGALVVGIISCRVPRPRSPLLAVCLLLAALTGCRRRAPGTCADHIDCDPGFDCVNQRCTRRPPVGAAPAPPPAEPEATPAAEAPSAPSPPPVIPPVPAPAAPRRPAARPARPDAAAAPVPVDDHLPAWKQRQKRF